MEEENSSSYILFILRLQQEDEPTGGGRTLQLNEIWNDGVVPRRKYFPTYAFHPAVGIRKLRSAHRVLGPGAGKLVRSRYACTSDAPFGTDTPMNSAASCGSRDGITK